MTKFKKITGIALAGCMALSSMMMTAGAVDMPTGNIGSPVMDTVLQDCLVDDWGVDWSKIDTSMCIPGTEYHRYPQNPVNNAITPFAADRAYFAGWVKGIPLNADIAPSTFSIPNLAALTFEDGEDGMINVKYSQGRSALPSVNISVFDIDDACINDWFTLNLGDDADFYVNPDHRYRFYMSNNHWKSAEARMVITVG